MNIVILGVPLDCNSSYLEGAATAPPLIKNALFSDSANMWTEDLIDLGVHDDWGFKDDLEFADTDVAFERIEREITSLLNNDSQVISLGGDHSITYPIMRAYAREYENLNILHFDAHPDIYDELGGNRHSHGSPFARIMEEGLVKRLVQVGIRTMTGHQKEQIDKFGVEVYPMNNIEGIKDIQFDGPIYVSFDMDCLDPAFAPGVSHHEPGGMSTREVLNIIQNLEGHIVGADIVEYNPDRDINGVTSMVAAKLLKELISRMLF